MSNQNWTTNDIPDLSGKLVVATGSNGSLGKACVKALTEKGAQVVMACRNVDKAEAARKSILVENPGASIEVMKLDNADLASVKAFADAFKEKYDRLDILFNNAGVMAIPRKLTKDGFEMQLGTNHLGHFALTGHLNELLAKTPGSRVGNTSSSAAFNAKINFDDLMGEKKYSRWPAYMQSKLANAVFATELDRRFKAAGQDTISNSFHPGLVIGNLQEESLSQSGSPVMEKVLYKVMGGLIGQTPEMGMLPLLFGITATEAKGGVFYGPKKMRVKGYPAEQKCNNILKNQSVLKRFWEVSEELTGVSYL